MEEELKQKLQQSGEELRTMPQNRSIIFTRPRELYIKKIIYMAFRPKAVQVGKFRTL